MHVKRLLQNKTYFKLISSLIKKKNWIKLD